MIVEIVASHDVTSYLFIHARTCTCTYMYIRKTQHFNNITFFNIFTSDQNLISRNCTSGINSVDKDGNTPLHAAAEAGNTEAISYLLAHGADSTILNANHEAAVHVAVEKNNPDVITVRQQNSCVKNNGFYIKLLNLF